MDTNEAFHALLNQHDEIDLKRAFLDKYGIDCAAFRSLLHLQGEINALVKEVESYREGY